MLLDIASPSTSYALSNTWTLCVGAGFKQFAYGDNTAQYSVDASAQLSKKLGRNLDIRTDLPLSAPARVHAVPVRLHRQV